MPFIFAPSEVEAICGTTKTFQPPRKSRLYKPSWAILCLTVFMVFRAFSKMGGFSAESAWFVLLVVHPVTPLILPHYGYNYLGAVWTGLPPFNLGLGGNYAFAGTNVLYKNETEHTVAAPSRMIVFGDSGAFYNASLLSPTNTDPSTFLYLAFPYYVPSVNRPAVGDWHNGGANQVFCDGHSEYAKQSVWIAATDAARCRWNNDNQPHPEYWGGQ